jgi:hypothetical protein
LRGKKLIAIWRNFAPKRTPCFNPGSDIFGGEFSSFCQKKNSIKIFCCKFLPCFRKKRIAKKKRKKCPPKFTTPAYNHYFSFCGEIPQLGEFFFQKMQKKKPHTHTHNSFVCDFRKKNSAFFEKKIKKLANILGRHL